jgi:hypothetical protein
MDEWMDRWMDGRTRFTHSSTPHILLYACCIFHTFHAFYTTVAQMSHSICTINNLHTFLTVSHNLYCGSSRTLSLPESQATFILPKTNTTSRVTFVPSQLHKMESFVHTRLHRMVRKWNAQVCFKKNTKLSVGEAKKQRGVEGRMWRVICAQL